MTRWSATRRWRGPRSTGSPRSRRTCGRAARFAARQVRAPPAEEPSWRPQLVNRLVRDWPVGGAKYRIQGHARFNEHAVYVQQHGLAGVIKLARESEKSFGGDPRGGPWVSVLRRDSAFADAYAALDPDAY